VLFVVVVLCLRTAVPIAIPVVRQQYLYQRPVRRHSLAKILGVDVAVLVCLGDAAGLPIALGDFRLEILALRRVEAAQL